MNNKLVAIITIFLAFILFLIIQPGDNPFMIMKIAGITASVVLFIIIIYTRYLWRVPPFSSMHKMIDVSGKWEGKATDKDGFEKIIKLRVRQYYDDVRVKLTGDDFVSESLICKLKRETTGLFLYIMYRSKNIEGVTSKSDMFYGTMIIRCDLDILVGEYFDSNNNHKTFELYRV